MLDLYAAFPQRCTQLDLEPIPQKQRQLWWQYSFRPDVRTFNNTIKNVIRWLGPNSTNQKAVDRFAKALTVNKKLLDKYDQNYRLRGRSGKHSVTSVAKNLGTIVECLMKNDVLTSKKQRKYLYFTGIRQSLLDDFD